MAFDTASAPPHTSANKDWLRALEMTARIDGEPARLLPLVIDDLAETHGDAPALLSDDETFSFRRLAERSRRYTRWAQVQGLAKGDVVALMMPNRPEYLAVWLGIGRTGAVTALINTNLTGPALAHALKVAAPKHLILDAEYEDRLDAVESPAQVWLHGEGRSAHARIDHAVDALSGDVIAPHEARDVTLRDPALMIYTSGTTGLPKAAYVSHHRMMSWTHWFAGLMDAGPGDRLYNCLPMYHSVGGVVAGCAALMRGGAVVLSRRFSAGRFWDDVARWDCTLFQYIGELARYLLAAPPHPRERAHGLRLACGNGLRADVWTAFQDRFAIPRVLEFYAATEGAFSLYNVEGRVGAIGRIPPFLAHRFPAAIVAYDPDTGAPARDAEGRCIRRPRGEVGEAIGRLAPGAGRFEGYSDAAESEKKILRDVFEPGDAWLRTGDLMRMDGQGYFYFVDRVGDTFRWKGENVSTGEVAEALGGFPGVTSACVYGVEVPGADGRAGMAAMSVDASFDLVALRVHLAERLPGYARPLFLRLVEALPVTETFKPKKQGLADEGFDPARVSDPLYVDDPATGTYAPLDAAMFARIVAGGVRF